jgi:ribosomal protein S18 acetylase RimI-like enzyme
MEVTFRRATAADALAPLFDGYRRFYEHASDLEGGRRFVRARLEAGESDRRGGVGGALMQAAEAFARETGSKGLMLATQKTNAPAKSLYEGHEWKIDALFDHYLRFF